MNSQVTLKAAALGAICGSCSLVCLLIGLAFDLPHALGLSVIFGLLGAAIPAAVLWGRLSDYINR